MFLALPWVRIGDAPAILLDIPGRRFSIFGLQFWAHDAPMIFFVLGGVALSLLFVTAIWGRLWCGWACPQTVFIDGVYRRIEKWVEGKAPKRKLLDSQPWTFSKIGKRLLKHVLFIAVTLVITHSFLAYFVGSDSVREMIFRPPSENWVSFLFTITFSGILYFNFAWFREQFCIIMCPYGRLQSALFDRNTMIVGYDKAREDCIECKKCVFACPTGIDIRDGVQLECIACTACMDACDEIMEKVKKPKGLIKYTSERQLAGQPRNAVNIRTIVYGSLLVILCVVFVTTLSLRKPFGVELIRTELMPKASPAANSIFHYSVELTNQTFVPKKFRLEIINERNVHFDFVIPANPVTVPPGRIHRTDFFLKMDSNQIDLPAVSLRVSPDGEKDFQELPLHR